VTKRVKITPKPEPEVAAADRRVRRRDRLRASGVVPWKLVKPVIFFIGDDWREILDDGTDAPPPDETLPLIEAADLVLAYFSKVDALGMVRRPAFGQRLSSALARPPVGRARVLGLARDGVARLRRRLDHGVESKRQTVKR
jgi:hypothetical protein